MLFLVNTTRYTVNGLLESLHGTYHSGTSVWREPCWAIYLKLTCLKQASGIKTHLVEFEENYHSLLGTEYCYSTACPENILSFSHNATPKHDLRVVGVWLRSSAAHNTSSARVSQLITTQNTRPDQCRETLRGTEIGKRTSRKLGVGDRKCSEGLTRKWSIGKIQE